MKSHNAENERIKRRYYAYLKEARRQSEATIDAVAKSLTRFEEHTKRRAFKAFHYQQAVAFKNMLAEQNGARSGMKLSKATLHATLANLKRFFQWLSGQAGYKSRFHYTDADYFNLSEKDVRVATAKRGQKSPTLEQVKYVLSQMPFGSDIERRNRALVAFTLLTGARDSAMASMRLKHVDLQLNCAIQDAREVNTKFSKTFTTFFFPVGDEVQNVVFDWVKYLREDLLWGNDDPLFPSTLMKVGESRQFEVGGLKRVCWSNASPIRKVFKEAFVRAGVPYFNPHSFRHLLVRHGQELCKTPEEFKAWSQNLGHEGVLTTFYSYGEVQEHRQADIFKQFNEPRSVSGNHSFDVDGLANALMEKMSFRNSA